MRSTHYAYYVRLYIHVSVLKQISAYQKFFNDSNSSLLLSLIDFFLILVKKFVVTH